MKIGINGFEAVVPRFGYNKNTGLPNRVGSSEYCFQLLNALSGLNSDNNYYIYTPIEPSKDLPKEKENWHYVTIKSKKIWTVTGLGKILFNNKNRLNIFFSPSHYIPLYYSVPTVVSILDVSYLYFPELFNKKDILKLKYWGKYSINKSKKILTISQSSKNDIIKAYSIKPEKIEVIYPGVKQEIEAVKYLSMEELNKKFGIESKYVLFVGTIQPRKNIKALIEAYSKLNTEVKLVIIGRKGWQYEEILSAPKKFGVDNKVIFLHEITDEDLPSFYKNAEFFILPSLYEGFGLPVLEAMKYDCPVITSNVSSLPEAGGDAALYVDPKDAEDIAQKMDKLLKDVDLRKSLIKKGHDQIKKFSWDKSARETLKVLEEVGNA